MTSHVIPSTEESPTVSVVEAGRAMGIGRGASYRMLKEGQFPLPVIRAGGKARIPTAALRRILELDVNALDLVRKWAADETLSVEERCRLALLLIGQES
jgi:hypothetical protein